MKATLNLVNSKVYDNNVPFKSITFPDGHRHIQLLEAATMWPNVTKLRVYTRLKSYNDIFILKQVCNAVRGVNKAVKIEVFITYLLAARWDRRMYTGDSEDLRIVANDINSLNFERVVVLEPHSVASTLLINDCHSYTPLDDALVKYMKSLPKQEEIVIFAPDLGAVKRVETFIKDAKLEIEVGYLHKSRNLLTGQILGMRVMDSPDLKGKTVILYDDLCDGGRTFIEAASLLREQGASKVVLAVTHGIISKGWEALVGIDHIIVTDSYQTFHPVPANVTVVPCL